MDSNRRDGTAAGSGAAPGGPWVASTQPVDYPDPAYASQAYEYPAQSTSYAPPPTSVLPPHYGSYGPAPSPPEPPRRSNTFWLWVIGCGALVVIIALVIALIMLIKQEDEQQSPVIAPPPSRTTTTSPAPAMPSLPSLPPIPSFSLPPLPGSPPRNGKSQPATETVTYDLSGTGTAFSVLYLDGTGSYQTEFNVKLPWHKEVRMTADQAETAMVVGADLSHDLTCTLTINGTQKTTLSGKFALCGGARG